MARSGKKKHKTSKEKEELPSFLEDLKEPPEDFSPPPKSKSKHYLGPIFFGDPCKEFQPPLHVLSLGAFRQSQRHTLSGFKPCIDELFYDFEEEEKKPCVKSKKFHANFKRKKAFYDPYPHKCPGTRKNFPLKVRTLKEDLGTTTSIIEGETSMEIPLCRFRRIPLCRLNAQPEIEFIMPSDLREEKWKYLSRIEQISHAHFPKRFVPVTVNGPNIPASITITRLQCKRTREYDDIFLKKPEEEENVQDMTAEEEEEEEELETEESHFEEDMIAESEAQFDEQSLKSDAFSVTTRSQQSVDMEKEEEDLDEGSEGRQGSSEVDEEFEYDGEEEIENDYTEEGETQEEEKTEEMEAHEEGNPDKEEEEGG